MNSSAKDRLYELINEIPESETEQILVIIEDYVRKFKKSKLNELYSDPIKVEGKVEIPSREERNAK